MTKFMVCTLTKVSTCPCFQEEETWRTGTLPGSQFMLQLQHGWPPVPLHPVWTSGTVVSLRFMFVVFTNSDTAPWFLEAFPVIGEAALALG